MIKINEELENYIPQLLIMLNMEKEPKWMALRFMINISLSLDKDLKVSEIDFQNEGKNYRLEQITGEGKGASDLTKFYWDAIEVFDNTTITSKIKLEENLQRHIFRGFEILKTSLKSDSSVFEFLVQDFYS